MQRVQKAVWNAREEKGVERPFLSRKLAVSGDLFWDDEDDGLLINLSRGTQLAIRELISQYLERVQWDEERDLPIQLYPYVSELSHSQLIVIDPLICFGQPTLRDTGIVTSVLLDRLDAGEDEGAIIRDYGIDQEMLTAAAVYERTKS